MSDSSVKTAIFELRRLLEKDAATHLSDPRLLDLFIQRSDEVAFEILLRRHGSMVWSVARRLLTRTQDAEDAFQAAFLALIKQGKKIRSKESIGGWLYRVVSRIARNLQTQNRPLPLLTEPTVEPKSLFEEKDLWNAVYEEIERLPQKQRAAFILCVLEGRSNLEAAREIGCPKGTIDSRLSTARHNLLNRLKKRGINPETVLALPTLLVANAAIASAPAVLMRTTLTLISRIVAGEIISSATVPVILSEGVLNTMITVKIKALALVLGLVLFSGAGAAIAWNPSDSPQDTKSKEKATLSSASEVAKSNKTDIQPGTNPGQTPEMVKKSAWETLQTKLPLDQPFEGSLVDFLAILGKLAETKIYWDYEAFSRVNWPIWKSEQLNIVIPQLNADVKLDEVLRIVTSQIKLSENAQGLQVTYRIKHNKIYLVPKFHDNAGQLDPDSKDPPRYTVKEFSEPTYIHRSSDKAVWTLSETIQAIKDATGTNIVVDPAAEKYLEARVALNFQNVPVLTAVFTTVQCGTDLDVVIMDNLLFITTVQKAESLRTKFKSLEKQEKKMLPPQTFENKA